MNRSVKNVLSLVAVAALTIPGQLMAQEEPLECEASIAGPDFGDQLFFAGDPITIDLQIGAGDVSGGPDGDPRNYLDITRFEYILDCDGAPVIDPQTGQASCPWAGNTVSLVPGSVTTNCTADGNPVNTDPQNPPLNPPLTLATSILNPAPPGVIGDPSPRIEFLPQGGPIRNFSQSTCEVSFQIVVTGLEGDNLEKIIQEYAGWTTADGICDSGEPATAGLPITFDLSAAVSRFLVTKNFTDDSDESVDVHLRCNSGLPLEQSSTIIDPQSGADGFEWVEFVVRYIDSGEVDCEIWEEPVPAGYLPTYEAAAAVGGVAGAISPENSTACEYTDILTGSFTCDITNEPEPITIVVTKEWIGDFEEYNYPLDAIAYYTCTDVLSEPEGSPISVQGSLEFNGASSTDTIDGLYANPYGNSTCTITEVDVIHPVLDDSSDCQAVPVEPGAECTIYNSIFHEGIPTLSRTGLAIMVLLMLGVGMVGFRRFA